MRTFALEIATPRTVHPPRQIVSVEVPGEEGRLTVLAGHEPMICRLRPGVFRVRNPNGGSEEWQTANGWLNVTPEGVTLLAQAADPRPPPEEPSGLRSPSP